MPRDPLKALLALRQREVDRQRQALADCLAAQAQAAATLRSIEAAMARDREVSDRFADRMSFRDIFLATRQHLEAERLGTVTALIKAEARSDAARGRLAEARLAAEAVDRLILERAATARTEADRRAQHELDDAARLRLK